MAVRERPPGSRKELLRRARRMGYEVRFAKNGHTQLFLDGRRVLSMSTTPSDGNALHAAWRDLKKVERRRRAGEL